MINLINIIVSEERYRDLFKLFFSLDDKVNQHIIYTQSYYTDISALKNTKVKTPPPRFESGFKFWVWVLFDILKHHRKSNKKWIVIEHLTGFVLYFVQKLKFVFKKKPTLVYASYSEDYYYLKNTVWRADGMDFIDEEQDDYYLNRWKKRVLKGRRYFDAADVVITNSPTILKWSATVLKKPNFRFYNPFEFQQDLLKENKTNRNIDILYVGNLTPAKGIELLLKSLRMLKHENLKTVLVGKVKPQDELWWEKIKIEYKDIKFEIHKHLPYNELVKLYKNSKLMVLPSYSEGSPRVFIEALGFGVSVLASDIDGNTFPEDLKVKNPILYFEQGNPEALKNTIIAFFCEDGLTIEKDKNTLSFIRQFDYKKIGDDLIEYLNTLDYNK